MYLVGLTGNVASGKSSVAALFASWGATVVDSDLLAREVVAPGTPALADIARLFGPGVLLADGSLDRPALRGRVMADESLRLALNGVVHPRVRERAGAAIRTAAAAGDLVVVADVPLLFEVRDPSEFDRIVLVDAPEEVRRGRLTRDRGLGEEEAGAIIRAQLPSGPKRERSHVVLDNDGTPERLAALAREAWRDLRSRAARHGLGAARAESLLAVFAHPDDETFGPGLALARYADAGLAVHVVCATGGEAAKNRAGHADPDALRRHREGELVEACLVLGVSTLELLRRRDRTLAADDPSGAAAVEAVIRRTRPDAIVTFGEDGISGHPDHRAVHHWTRRAWAAAGRPCPLWYAAMSEETAAAARRAGRSPVGRPAAEIAARLDGRPWLDVKEAAVRCHASQRYPVPLDVPEWRERVAREVFAREGFVPGGAPKAADLFSLDTAGWLR